MIVRFKHQTARQRLINRAMELAGVGGFPKQRSVVGQDVRRKGAIVEIEGAIQRTEHLSVGTQKDIERSKKPWLSWG